jgi:hypothetical protein
MIENKRTTHYTLGNNTYHQKEQEKYTREKSLCGTNSLKRKKQIFVNKRITQYTLGKNKEH